jgi:cytochrome c biogenesis protein CcmG, thiol:disulfide interchange protein DsbE
MKKQGRLSLRLAAAVMLIGLLGCEAPERPPRVGDPLPDLAYASLETGEMVSLSSYEGQVLLVNLWATWCPPCRAETPYLQSLSEEFRDEGFRVVGISTDDASAIDVVKMFTSEAGVTYDILLDPESSSTDVFGAFGLPMSLLVDREGVIRWFVMAPILENDPTFLQALRELLG